MNKLTFNQNTFAGGLNYEVDSTRIKLDELALLMNGRTRYDVPEPVFKHLLTDDGGVFPAGGLYQALIVAGNYALVFINGLAFYKNYSVAGTAWAQVTLQDGVTPLQMSPAVPRIYLQQIPASTINYARLPASANASAVVSLTTKLAASPQAILVQDGITQPYVIFANGQARITGTYADWTEENREYVPIGTLMLYYNGVMYLVNGPKILRSVTGRPLDFMVVLDAAGTKLLNPVDGDAYAVSHQIDYDDITCIARVNSNVGGFVVSTLRNTTLIIPDFDQTLFGEPTFKNTPLFNTGAMNDTAFADILGDAVLGSFKGLRSFNAVLQDRNEGRNLPFSKPVFRLFTGIVQTSPCFGEFDDYTIFDVNTIYGRAWIIFDQIKQRFVSVDVSSVLNGAPTKQFAIAKTVLVDKLLFITSSGLYEAFSDASAYETLSIYIGDTTSGNPGIEIKTSQLKLVLINARAGGIVYATLYVDGKATPTLQESIPQQSIAETIPITAPFGYAGSDLVKNIVFRFPEAPAGWKAGVFVSWDFNAQLSNAMIEFDTLPYVNALETQATQFSFGQNLPENVVFAPVSGPYSTVVQFTGSGLLNVTSVTLNGLVCAITTQTDTELWIVLPYGVSTGRFKLVTTYGFFEPSVTFTVTP